MTTESPVYWAANADARLEDILASNPIHWDVQRSAGGFSLSADRTTLTLPAGSLFMVVFGIWVYSGSDHVMRADLFGSGLLPGVNEVAVLPSEGEDYGTATTTMLATGGTLVASTGYGNIAPTKGRLSPYLHVTKLA